MTTLPSIITSQYSRITLFQVDLFLTMMSCLISDQDDQPKEPEDPEDFEIQQSLVGKSDLVLSNFGQGINRVSLVSQISFYQTLGRGSTKSRW